MVADDIESSVINTGNLAGGDGNGPAHRHDIGACCSNIIATTRGGSASRTGAREIGDIDAGAGTGEDAVGQGKCGDGSRAGSPHYFQYSILIK